MHARTRASLPLLLAALAAACAPAGGPAATTPSPAPTAVASAGATAAPSPAPSAAPTAAPSAPATPGTPPATTGTTIAGLVTDLAGAPVPGVRVTARELGLAGEPRTGGFVGEGTTGADGRYAIPGAPAAVDLEVVARRAGWTPRRLVGSVAGATHALDFGGTGAGAARFLADRPEITSTTPLNGARLANQARLAYVLTLSEPLDEANRQRFAAAVRLQAASREAGGGEDLGLHEDVYPFERLAKAFAGWEIAQGTAFDALVGRARVDWSDDGLVATLAFDAPLLAHESRDARYQVVLAAGAEPIRDADGHTLGTGPDGALDTWPAEGGLVLGAFHDPNGRLEAIADLADEAAARWAATHASYAGFRLAADGAPPKLVEVRVEDGDGDTRVLLTFDEPLVAYDGTEAGVVGAGTGQAAADLEGLTFAVGERGDLAGVRLDGDPAAVIDPRAHSTFGEDADRNREFGFDPAAFAASAAGEPDGTITLEVDERDATTLVLTIHGRGGFFDDELEEIEARAEGPADPAGNARDEDDADADVVTGDI